MLAQYARQRDLLLSRITASLAGDPRIVAAWLGGSFGAGNADDVSDLDLVVVVSHVVADRLCAQPDTATARPPVERLTLFAQFGAIGFAYENNDNAPGGGTSTSVMYAPSGVMVDWTLLPEKGAQRPESSRLLFARVDVPLVPPPTTLSQAQQAIAASDSVAFFWMMAAVTAKYIIRGDSVFVVQWLERLAGLVREVEGLVAGQPSEHRRGSVTELQATRIEQLALLRMLCRRIEAVSPSVAALGGEIWSSAAVGVEGWLDMVVAESG